MKRSTVILLTAIVALGFSVPGAAVSLDDGPAVSVGDAPSLEVRPTEQPMLFEKEDPYIVGFYELPNDRATYKGEEVTKVDEDLAYFVVDPEDRQDFEERARQDHRVRYIELDHNEWYLDYVPDDALYGDMYGPQITNTESAWDTTLGATSVKLGLLDSGITTDHEDFVNSRVSGWDYVNGDSTPEDHNGCNYHGSHTAGTAAATTDNGVGVAGMSQSSIIMHKIFDSGFFGCGATSTSNIADALRDMGTEGAHISSNSWGGGGESSTLNNAIADAHSNGVIHVAAAGNSGSCTDCISEPWVSNPDKVIIVTCSDSGDNFCSFSSQGPETDIIAPGNNILSVDGGGTSSYQELSGTSMSTPHVSGAIGLYIDANGDAAFSTIEDELKNTADDLGLSPERQGAGRLNTGAFVGSDGGGGEENSPPTASFTYTCTDLTCDFDGSGSSDSDGSIASYDWDFGDGNTDTGATVQHTYAAGGTYTVTLTVTDDDGATDSTSEDVSVSDGGGGGDTMHVHDLDLYEASKGRPADRDIAVDATIYDNTENPVSSADVCVTFTDNGDGSTFSDCGTTGSDGVATITWQNAGRGSYTVCVDDVTHATLTYDSTADHASEGSCHTE